MENLEKDGSLDQTEKLDPEIEIFDKPEQVEIKDPVESPVTISHPARLGSFFNFIKGHKFWIAGIAAFFILSGGIAWGMSLYEHYLRVLPIESVLPADANVVVKITIDPDGEQFKLLESNLEKFPGYTLLKKKLDKAGEGKTVSQLIQDKVKERGLDFQSDIKPVISDQAYVVIPDASPLGKNIQNEALLTFDAQKNNFLASTDPDNRENVVLGDSTEKATPIPMDFIVAAEIINKGKAKEVLEKLQKDNRYAVTTKTESGYTYYELKAQEVSEADPSYINYAVTYHVLLGSNWVFASREDYLKQAIAATKKQQIFSGFFSKTSVSSLKDNQDFQKVSSDLGNKDGDDLLRVYYKLNFSDFFGRRDCPGDDCSGVSDYIKYPENIIAGFLVRVEEEGIAITTESNGTSLGDLQNVPAEKSLAQVVPSQIDQRWTDVFFEYGNLKDLYYGFKKNNLTEKGLTEWNDTISQIKDISGIDPELNFIDLIKGNSTLMLFTKKSDAPEGAAIFEITDPEKMNDTMHKLVEAIKKTQMESYAIFLDLDEESNFDLSYNPQYAKMDEQMQEMQKKYQAAFDRVKNSSIQETTLPEGKIYSYSIESPKTSSLLPAYSVTLNYSLEDGRFIFSTAYPAVQSLLASLKDGSQETSLASSDSYKSASRHYAPQMYANAYVFTQGICNSVEYFYYKFSDNLNSVRTELCSQQERDDCQKQQEQMLEAKKKWDDSVFAGLAVLRTLKLTGGYNAMADKSIKSAWFLNIVEIPKEEKARAEKILEQL